MTLTNSASTPPFRMAVANAKRFARKMRDRWNRLVLRKVATSPLAAGIYYGFFNREMMRESMAVAAGQIQYIREREEGPASYFLLRRNIHRLEKALIMRPLRPSFASDYIEETVNVFARAVQQAEKPWSRELCWFADVLARYFSIVDASPRQIAAALRRYRQIPLPPAAGEAEAAALVPYPRDLTGPPPVEYEQMMALARRRRSVRWYADQPVPRDMIDRALLVAAQAPSACNRQPFVFRIFDDKEMVAKVSEIPMGTRGFSQQFPAVAVVVGQLRAYPFERDRHVIYIDASLAAMSFVFALESMGLASCVINWPDQEPHESRMKKALSLDDDERVVMLIAFGWPDRDGLVPYSAKRELTAMRSYN